MNVEKVESLLERSRPAPPSPELRRRILEAIPLKAPPVPVRRPRFVEVMTVAASILMLLATLSWLLRATPPAPTPGTQDPGHPFEERKLTADLAGEWIREFVWSADGKHWGCIAPAGKGEEALLCAVIDGKREKEYQQVSSLRFGADGRYAYIAADREGFVLVRNGVPQKNFESIDSLSWSPDGKKFAVVGVQESQTFVFEDGRKSGPYWSVKELLWSPDGSLLAYGARIDQDWFCVVDGKKGEPFDDVRHLAFAPDGKTLAYTAREGDALVVVGKAKGKEYSSVGPPIFSADGSALGYRASNDQDWFVLVGPRGGDLVNSRSFEDVGNPVLSRDGKVWACRAKHPGGNKESVLLNREMTLKRLTKIDGQEKVITTISRVENMGQSYDSVSDPVLNADGSLVAYAAGKGSRKYLVIGDDRTLKFSMIDNITFGPDNKTVAFRAGQYGKQLVVAGESRSDEVDEILSGPVWSKDGKKVAFTARNGSEVWSKVLEVK